MNKAKQLVSESSSAHSTQVAAGNQLWEKYKALKCRAQVIGRLAVEIYINWGIIRGPHNRALCGTHPSLTLGRASGYKSAPALWFWIWIFIYFTGGGTGQLGRPLKNGSWTDLCVFVTGVTGSAWGGSGGTSEISRSQQSWPCLAAQCTRQACYMHRCTHGQGCNSDKDRQVEGLPTLS
jgi:hypothetical protein